MKLYEIEQAILDCIDPDTGEIADLAMFEELQIEREVKIDNIACLYKSQLAEAEAIKHEIEHLSERQKTKKAQAERLKIYLSDTLGGEKFETARNKISWRSSARVKITDAERLPSNYVRTVSIREPIKDDIKKAINAGNLVPGAELVRVNNIQIK